jgi:hypothetical protein
MQQPNSFTHRPDGVTEIMLERRDGTALVCYLDEAAKNFPDVLAVAA